MRLGIHPILKREAGGIYQYGITVLEALDALSRARGGEEWVVLAHEVDNLALSGLQRPLWVIRPFRPPGACAESAPLEPLPIKCGDGKPFHLKLPQEPNAAHKGRRYNWPVTAPESVSIDAPRHQADMQQWMTECGIEMMLYPAPHRLSFETDIPFVMAIHDLQHRLQPEFPEVSADGEWERREYLFRNAARRATLLIAESQVGREDILRFYGDYGVTAEMVKVLPYLPTRSATTVTPLDALRTTYAIPERFFFYPAQFWPHKNHRRMVQALGMLRREGLQIPLVLTGSASGELRTHTHAEMLQEAERLGVRGQVFDLGYVADDELAGLYRAAAALIMPTFFGPTNIPILEAWAHGCPVLTSDIRGVRDQAGDAALLVDPCSVASLADGMRQLWTDAKLRGDLVARGTQRIGRYTADDYRTRLSDILGEAKDRLRRQHAVSVGA